MGYFLKEVRVVDRWAKASKQILDTRSPLSGDYAAVFSQAPSLKKFDKNKKIPSGVVDEAIEAAQYMVRGFAEGIPTLGALAKEALVQVGQWLCNEIPRIIKTFLGAILSELDPFKDFKNIATNLKKAAEKGYTAYRSGDLSKLLRSGEAAQVVEAVVVQIKTSALTHVAQGLDKGFTSLLKMAPPLGQVYGAMKKAFNYIAKIYFHFRNIYKMERIVLDAQTQYEKAMKDKRGGLFRDANKFQKWFKDVIDDMPIVASYVMGNPLTGSFTGFLSASSKGGQALTDFILADNLKRLDDVKEYARQFIQESETKIEAKSKNNKLIVMSLQIANGEKIKIKEFNKEFEKMQKREKWELQRAWSMAYTEPGSGSMYGAAMVPWFVMKYKYG